MRGVLPESALSSMEEQLSGACTVEIAAFNEFTGLLADPDIGGRLRSCLFDTAPTGHTAPAAEPAECMERLRGEQPRGRELASARWRAWSSQREQYAAAVATLGDRERTTLVLVARADSGALREAARASTELSATGRRQPATGDQRPVCETAPPTRPHKRSWRASVTRSAARPATG